MPEDVKRVDKPWGYELHWAKTDRYVGKLIHVDAGHALSLQYHNKKDETIFLWAGRLLFEIQEQGKLVKREMKLGESVHVTPGTVHRMTAIDDCDIFEVSTPELDDVVRLEDRYGRRRRTAASCQLRPADGSSSAESSERHWRARLEQLKQAVKIAAAAHHPRSRYRSSCHARLGAAQIPGNSVPAGVAALLKGTIAWAV